MSFRNTFVTDFIYSAGEGGYVEASQELNKLFEEWMLDVTSKMDERGYGYFAGRSSTSGGSIGEFAEGIREFIGELEYATKVPFRLTYMLESNAVITYDIQPFAPLTDRIPNE